LFPTKIDTSCDVRDDTPENGDPDRFSRTLYYFHKFLWSKHLPSGALLDLEVVWNGKFELHSELLGESYLTSDSIIHTYREWRQRTYGLFNFGDKEDEEFIKLSYTIGGYLVFPGKQINHKKTINGARGFDHKIGDRFDLTLECILRYYSGDRSPLADDLQRYGKFFDEFEDFRGYVNFFLLQDLVCDDYSRVNFLIPFNGFGPPPRPSLADYEEYRRRSMEFVKARNRRIDTWARLKAGRRK
jgi:hypothetical protein